MKNRVHPEVRRLVMSGVAAAIAGNCDLAELYFLAAECVRVARQL
ncbi:MAG TPA: hypothetical protein VKA60_27635 [Blastocatellia bacterium]|nr:hypothetical protein [Blastocatellia bacterium]